MECMFTLFKEGKTGKGTQRLGMKTIWIFKVFPFSQVVEHTVYILTLSLYPVYYITVRTAFTF